MPLLEREGIISSRKPTLDMLLILSHSFGIVILGLHLLEEWIRHCIGLANQGSCVRGVFGYTALYKISMLLLRFPHQFDRKKNVNRFEQFWVGISLKNSKLLKLSLIVIYRIDYRRWDQFFWNFWLISFLEQPSNLR